MPYAIHIGGNPAAAVNAEIGKPFSLTLVIEGGAPDAVIGETYEVAAPAAAIAFDQNDVQVTAVDAANNNRAELEFTSAGGFTVAGTHKVDIRKANEQAILASVQVIAATALPAPRPPVGGGGNTPATPTWWSKFGKFVLWSLIAVGVLVCLMLLRSCDKAFVDSHNLPKTSASWIAQQLSSSPKPSFASAKDRAAAAKAKADAEALAAAAAKAAKAAEALKAGSAGVQTQSGNIVFGNMTNSICCNNGAGGVVKPHLVTSVVTPASGQGSSGLTYPNVYPSPCVTCSP